MIKVLQIGCSINPGGVENIVFNYFFLYGSQYSSI